MFLIRSEPLHRPFIGSSVILPGDHESHCQAFRATGSQGRDTWVLLEPAPAYLGCGGYGGWYSLEVVLAMVSWGPRLPRTIIIMDMDMAEDANTPDSFQYVLLSATSQSR